MDDLNEAAKSKTAQVAYSSRMLFIDHMKFIAFCLQFSAICLYGAITRNKTINAGVFHVASIACMITCTAVRNRQVQSQNRQKSREWKKNNSNRSSSGEEREKNILQTRWTDHLHSVRWRDKSKSLHCTAKKARMLHFFHRFVFRFLPS